MLLVVELADIIANVIADLPAMEVLPDVTKVAEFKNPTTGQVSVWTQLKYSTIINGLKLARIKFDKHLRNYVHANDKGSDLTTSNLFGQHYLPWS